MIRVKGLTSLPGTVHMTTNPISDRHLFLSEPQFECNGALLDYQLAYHVIPKN